MGGGEITLDLGMLIGDIADALGAGGGTGGAGGAVVDVAFTEEGD